MLHQQYITDAALPRELLCNWTESNLEKKAHGCPLNRLIIKLIKK